MKIFSSVRVSESHDLLLGTWDDPYNKVGHKETPNRFESTNNAPMFIFVLKYAVLKVNS